MANVSLVGESVAGGVIAGPGAPNWRVTGKAVSLLGDAVTPHGNGQHAGPVMVTASPWMKINGKPVVRAGSVASCGHVANGNPWMKIP